LFAKAHAAKQDDAAFKAMMLACDTLETAIALTKNQIAAYVGLATVYSMVGKSKEAQNWAKQGLSELDKMRQDPSASAQEEQPDLSRYFGASRETIARLSGTMKKTVTCSCGAVYERTEES
jgi:hypothetical protein